MPQPSAPKLRATLPSPPSTDFCDCTPSTGIGASGEMRRTAPYTKRSSMISPVQATIAELTRSSVGIRCSRPLTPSPSYQSHLLFHLSAENVPQQKMHLLYTRCFFRRHHDQRLGAFFPVSYTHL